MKQYTDEQIRAVKRFGFEQFNNDDYTVCVLSEETGQDVCYPWVDSSARWEFDTIEEAVEEWGEELVEEFCDKVLDHLKGVTP